MALDASIYGQLDTQAPLRLSQMIREANNPMAQAQQMLSLKQMLQQGKLQELQMQQAQAEMAQKAEDRAATRAALADFYLARLLPRAEARCMEIEQGAALPTASRH